MTPPLTEAEILCEAASMVAAGVVDSWPAALAMAAGGFGTAGGSALGYVRKVRPFVADVIESCGAKDFRVVLLLAAAMESL